MSMHYLGDHFDIHCGGVDNIFPHHENEIAQSRCATDGEFVNYWLHNEHLLVDNQKMSKSLGNFYTIRDLVDKGFTPESIRYTLISTHYRQKLNFTLDKLKSSQKSINKIREVLRRIDLIKDDCSSGLDFNKDSNTMIEGFTAHLKNDLNISGALGEMFIWINKIFKELDENNISASGRDNIANALDSIDRVLGIVKYKESSSDSSDKIQILIKKRQQARAEKNWDLADQIREEIDQLGYVVEDTPEGPVAKRK
tara:strand:- start:122 stop:883 length:762 start_codon:yes stop_codon:yes gene_type:complete